MVSESVETHSVSNSSEGTHEAVDPTYNTASSWAGYEVSTPSNENYVTTDFIVPTVTCPPSGDSHVSMWAGAGTGVGSDDLYQTGVSLVCSGGTEYANVWWEDYPQNAEQDYGWPFLVSTGDKIVAQVAPLATSGSNHLVELDVYDYSSLAQLYPNWDAHHEITLTSAPSVSTSECVAERPLVGGSPADLLDFGSIDFSTATSGSFSGACDVTASATDHIISSSVSGLNHGLTGSVLDITNASNSVLADTSLASSSGDFTVTWDAAN